MKKTASGFTLVELLVVITIMAIVGAYSLANFSNFGEDQKLKSATQDVQSLIRQAQSNASTNAQCNTGYSATWQVVLTDATTVNLNCQEPSASPVPILKKTLQLSTNNSQIQTIAGVSPASCPSGSPPFSSPYPTVSFDPLTGKVNFGNSACTSLTITLVNNKNSSTKDVKIEQGGRIYAP